MKEYGKDLFKLADKLYVVEYTLINLPELKNTTVENNMISAELDNRIIAGYIYDNWFNLSSPPPWGLNEWKQELEILANFQKIHPDNIIVVFNDLSELSFLNRTYSNDELMSVSEVRSLLYE